MPKKHPIEKIYDAAAGQIYSSMKHYFNENKIDQAARAPINTVLQKIHSGKNEGLSVFFNEDLQKITNPWKLKNAIKILPTQTAEQQFNANTKQRSTGITNG